MQVVLHFFPLHILCITYTLVWLLNSYFSHMLKQDVQQNALESTGLY